MGKDSRRLAKKESRRRRRIAMACARRDTAPPATSIYDVPDDLLELILLRVRTPFCLFRAAAAACKPWRRLIAGAGFLRRFRTLHGRRGLLLGHYCVNPMAIDDDGIGRLHAVFYPASPPRPATHLRQRLCLHFLPQPPPFSYGQQRVLTDSHGGLLAFVSDNWYAVVCDPWTREYREIKFPWGRDSGNRDRHYHCIGAFFLDAGGDGGNGGGSPMSSFRVLCACLVLDYMDNRIEAHACVFSARHDRWLRPSVWRNAGHDHWTGGVSLDLLDTYKRIIGRAGGCIFWLGVHGHVLVLDEISGEFSSTRLPGPPPDAGMCCRHQKQNLRVVGGGGGAVRIVRVVDDELEVLTRSHGAWEWTVERRVGLYELANIEVRPGRSWRFLDTAKAATAELVIGAFTPSSNWLLFSLDVETMKLQRLDRSMVLSAEGVFPYELPWPQTISAGL